MCTVYSAMVDINADDYAVPIECTTELEPVMEDVRESPCASINLEVQRNEYLSDYFALKHKYFHCDINALILYGKVLILRYEHTCTEKVRPAHELFTPMYRHYPLSQSYTVKWMYDVKTPVLFPGKETKPAENFSSPFRIVNSYLRAQHRRFKDSELVLHRDPYNLRAQKRSTKRKKYRTLYTTRLRLFLCKPEEQIATTAYDPSVLFKSNPKWTKEEDFNVDSSLSDGNDGHISADEEQTDKETAYDSNETLIYHDDALSEKSATETDCDLPSLADVEEHSATETESDTAPTDPDNETTEPVKFTLTETQSVTKTVQLDRKMDIISVSQETALRRLLEVDISDLIDDEDMKREIQFFREERIKEEVSVAPEHESDNGNTEIIELRSKLRAARKRKADKFQFLSDALDDVKRLKQECSNAMAEVTNLESEIDSLLMPPENEEKISSEAISEITKGLSAATVTPKLDKDGIEHVDDTTTSRVLDSASDLLCSKKHHEAKFRCALCKKEYYDKKNFQSHLDYHTGVTHKCNLCDKPPFTSAKAYQRHINWHASGSKMLLCQVCGKGFEYEYRLTSHEKTHEEPTLHCRKAEGCSKVFTFNNERTLHEKYGHLKQKLFQCESCEKFYTAPPLLRVHQNAFGHSGIHYK